jgi:hypothetical protein
MPDSQAASLKPQASERGSAKIGELATKAPPGVGLGT